MRAPLSNSKQSVTNPSNDGFAPGHALIISSGKWSPTPRPGVHPAVRGAGIRRWSPPMTTSSMGANSTALGAGVGTDGKLDLCSGHGRVAPPD